MQRKHWRDIAAVIAAIVGVLGGLWLIRVPPRGFWDWTGLDGKTAWDAAALLIVPLVLALVAFGLSNRQKRFELEQARQERKNDRQIARDHEEEITLQTYFDRMATLLLEHDLRDRITQVLDFEYIEADVEIDEVTSRQTREVFTLAQARTAATLRRLSDVQRRNALVAFLQNTGSSLLRSIDLRGIDLSKIEMVGMDLHAAKLSKACLQGANLWGAKLCRAELERANLQQANLYGAFLWEATLQGANLEQANLQQAVLSKAKLQGAILDDTTLQRAILPEADLQQAKLRRSNLEEAGLQQALLGGADLEQANLQQALLGGANLEQANLQQANLLGANLQNAGYSDATQWPAGFDPAAHGLIYMSSEEAPSSQNLSAPPSARGE